MSHTLERNLKGIYISSGMNEEADFIPLISDEDEESLKREIEKVLEEELNISFVSSGIKVSLVNLTTNRIISEPLGLEIIAGSILSAYGKEVTISVIDTQFGMTPEQVRDTLKQQEPDLIGISAQLESHVFLNEVLERIRKDEYLRNKKIMRWVKR